MSQTNRKPEAVLLDYEVPFFFNEEKFCLDLARAIGDDALADMLHRILFKSGLYLRYNSNGAPFESIFECVYPSVKCVMKEPPPREILYDAFAEIWNACLLLNETLAREVLEKIRAPVALVAVANYPHCEKIKASPFLKTRCKSFFIFAPKQWERYDLADVVRAKLAPEMSVPPHAFLYIGNNGTHEAAMTTLGIRTVRHEAPWDVLYKELAEHQLV